MPGTKMKQETKQAVKPAMPRQRVVRDRLLETTQTIESSYVEMAELLSEAYRKEYYQSWGFEKFSDYCETELEVDYRKALYYLDIWEKIKQLELPKARVAKLGWTKMKDIALVITKDNAQEMLEKAEKMSTRELTESVRLMKGGSKETLPKVPATLKLNFTLGESEHQIVMEALEEAKRMCNSDNMAVGLEMICQDWLTDKGAKPQLTHLEDHITYLEKVYPVKINFTVKKEKAKAKAEEVVKKAAQAAPKPKGKKERVKDPEEIGSEGPNVEDLLNV